MKQLKSNKGFTLVELVVVIAILGILAGIAIPRFMEATATARGARIEADLRSIDSAEAMYYAANGSYATAVAGLVPSYLAATPVAPTGDVRYHGATAAITNAITAYTVGTTGTTLGRALLGTQTVEQLVNN